MFRKDGSELLEITCTIGAYLIHLQDTTRPRRIRELPFAVHLVICARPPFDGSFMLTARQEVLMLSHCTPGVIAQCNLPVNNFARAIDLLCGMPANRSIS